MLEHVPVHIPHAYIIHNIPHLHPRASQLPPSKRHLLNIRYILLIKPHNLVYNKVIAQVLPVLIRSLSKSHFINNKVYLLETHYSVGIKVYSCTYTLIVLLQHFSTGMF